MSVIKIGKKLVGENNPTFIVAEISANHNQSFSRAKKLIRAAAAAKVDAVKLQTYTPDTMTIDSDQEWFQIKNEHALDSWQKKTLYQLYGEAQTLWEWHKELKELAESLGLIFFSTPFDNTAVDFLQKLKVPCFKIASYEVTDTPLLEAVARTKKPVIISVGFASEPEVKEAIKTLRENGTRQIAVLHCVTSYVSDPELPDMNLRTIRDIANRFGVVSGFSDNNGGVSVPNAAVLAGASIIEKHITLNRAEGGHDAQFSLEPEEFKMLVKIVRESDAMLGKVHYGVSNRQEKQFSKSRRSLFAGVDIKKGERLSKKNVFCVRPGIGLEPKYFDKITKGNYKAVQALKKGTPLQWKLIKV